MNNGTGYQVNIGTGNTCERLPITDVGACRAAASALRKRFHDDVDIPGNVSDGVGRFDYAPGGCFEYYGNSTRSSTTFTMLPGIYFNITWVIDREGWPPRSARRSISV